MKHLRQIFLLCLLWMIGVNLCVYAQWAKPHIEGAEMQFSERPETAQTYYLYNEEACAFFTEGNAWGTQASYTSDNVGLQVYFSKYVPDGGQWDGSTIFINVYSESKKWWKKMSIDCENTLFVDHVNQVNYFWSYVRNGDSFRFFGAQENPQYNYINYPNSYMGINKAETSNILFPLLSMDDIAAENYLVDWKLIPINDAKALLAKIAPYQAAKALKELIDQYSADPQAASIADDIAKAQAVYNNTASTVGKLKTAKEKLMFAYIYRSIATATEDNPQDATGFVKNPDFSSHDTDGWTCGFIPGVNATIVDFYADEKAELNGFFEAWSNSDFANIGYRSLGDAQFCQTLQNLPAGKYKLSCDAIAVNGINATTACKGVYLFADNNNESYKTIISTDNNTPQHFELTFITNGDDVTFGLRTSSTTARWIACNNFTLTYYGQETQCETVYRLDMSGVKRGEFPPGWIADDNGIIHQYILNGDGSIGNYEWGENIGGGGARVFTGFIGSDFTKAIYWRSLSGNGHATLTYGEQVNDFELSDGTYDPEMPENIQLYLEPGKYQISFLMAAWKFEGEVEGSYPMFDFMLQDVKGNETFTRVSNIEARPCTRGSYILDEPSTQTVVGFTINTPGYYMLKFEAHGYKELLMAKCNVLRIDEDEIPNKQTLQDLINTAEDMAVATDFPGKVEFRLAIETAKEVAFADYIDNPSGYTVAFNTLSKARIAYLNSQDSNVDGSKDFTMLIKNPWFVNAEYTPEYLPVDGEEANKAWQLTEETWADRSALGNPGNYSDKVGGRTDIASDVVLSADVEATNQWFKRVNYDGWSPGLQLYYQSCLIGPSSGWNSINTGSEEICQQLVGLPEGYYSLKALMRGDAGLSWTTPDGVSSFHNIYAMNSAEEVVKSDFNATVAESNNNMSNGWYDLNPLAWVEHKTGIIQVLDGKLLIAAQTTNVMNATGFRLYFHGESPAFDKIIKGDIDAVNEKYEALAFAGDRKVVKDLLDQIVLPIGTDAALYEANMALIKEANKYMATVNDYMKNYKAVENFTDLQGGYAEGTDQFAIIDVPFQYVLALGEKDTETYEDAKAADKMYTAYAEYMPVFDKALKYQTQEIATLLADQTAYLKANMADPTLLKEYVAALSIPTNIEMIKQLGGETASEENPLDITSILKNPTFVDTSGWEGTSISQNEYARNNADIWNQTTFDFYQSIPYMPAGKYKVTAQALYRDGAGSADLAKCYQNWLDAGQDKNEWANHNATLYVKAGGRTGKDYVTSVCDTKNTELSFSDYFDFEGGDYSFGGNGKFLLYEELNPTDKAEVDAEGRENYGTVYDPAGDALGQYPFDGRIDLGGRSLFFPESMAGAALRFREGDYGCEAIVNALEEGTLQVGINKTAGVSGDWVIFTNFKLYYLGEPEQGPEFYAGSVSSVNGQQVTLPIYLNNEKDVCNLQFDIKVPEGITIAQKGTRIKTFDISLSALRFRGLDHSITSALQEDGCVRVLVSSTQNTSIWNTDEEGNDIRKSEPVVNVTLDVASGLATGSYSLLIKNIVLTSYVNGNTELTYPSDCSAELSVLSIYNVTASSIDSRQGTVSIASDSYDANTGTANANESITVTATPNTGYVFWKWQENGYDVSTENPYTFTLTSDRHLVALFVMLGDVLEDGQVNVGDLTETAGYILRSETPDGGTMLAADVYKDGVINVGDFTSIAGIILNGYSSGVKSREAEDARRKVVNLQFDIELPSGIGLAAEQVVSSLRQTSLGVNHGIIASTMSDGSIRVLVVSYTNAAVSKAEEALKSIILSSDKYQGAHDITLKNIVFAFNDYSVENIGEMSSTLLFAAPTGINGFKGASATDSRIYDINGRKQNKVGKGVNIINGKKVYKK